LRTKKIQKILKKVRNEKEKFTEKEQEKILTDPVAFFTFATKTIPFEYQAKFLVMKGKRTAWRAGRQVGKSTTCAVKALFRAFMNPKEQILILSPTQRQSSLMFWKIKEFISENELISEAVIRETRTLIQFDNGSLIHSLPSGIKGTTIMGFSPTLIIIDEAAFVSEETFTAILPSLASTNGDLILISTPFGRRGRFYEAFKTDSGFQTLHVRSSQCPLITGNYLREEKKGMTRDEYMQQYNGEFIAEADNFFKKELILSCIGEFEEGQLENCPKYLGVDFARYGLDETVFTSVAITQGGQIATYLIEAVPKSPITSDVQKIKELWNEHKYEAIILDSSGVGGGGVDMILEWAEKHEITILPVNFTFKERANLYKHLKSLMEQHRIWMPDDKKLIHQLSEIRYQYLTGGLKLEPPPRGHDDYTDALCLAVKMIPLVTETESEDEFFISSS